VYDPFCGSGTAIIAAEKLGRACYAMDIDPQYVQAAVRRWEAFTGEKAVRHRVTRLTTRKAR
jgi:DNA modification methylase